MTWPNGRFGTGRTGHGRTLISPSTTREMASVSLPPTPRPTEPEPQPFRSVRPLEALALAGDVEYRLDPDGWTFENSWAATPFTFIRFKGRLASSGASAFPFHVTSHDWQESDRVLSRIMTAVSGPTGAVEVAGRGTFDGEMTGTFSAPRVAGRFDSYDTRVWDVTWGAPGRCRYRGWVLGHREWASDERRRRSDHAERPLRTRIPEGQPRRNQRACVAGLLADGRFAPCLRSG